MSRNDESELRKTFSSRANDYESESEWVTGRRFIEPLVPSTFGNARMLDACTGTGVVAKFGQALGWHVTAIDAVKPMLGKSVLNEEIVSVEGDILNSPLNGRFDLLTCRQGLQYLPLDAAAREFARLCPDGEIRLGHITLEDEDDEDWWEQYFRVASPARLHVFAPGMVRTFFESMGYQTLSVEIKHSRSSFIGPISHLPSSKRRKLIDHAIAASFAWKDRYECTPTADGNFQYSNRWEFVVLTPSLQYLEIDESR